MILSVADFTGKYELHTGMYDQNKIQAYIDKYEPRYLRQLLGVDLAADFVADLNNQQIPRSPNFLEIYNPFAYDSGYNFYLWNGIYEGTGQLLSDGIKEMLLGFIYFEYAKDLVNQMTPFGNVKPKSENSDIANTLFSMMYTRYNESITSYRAIQHYVRMNNPVMGQLIGFFNAGIGSGYISGAYDLLGGTGTGGQVTVLAKGIGAANQITLTNGGGNYGNGTFGVTGGTGSGLQVDITTFGGVVVSVDVNDSFEGLGYTNGDLITINSGDVDATFTIDIVFNGQIFFYGPVTQQGSGYTIGDLLTLDGGNLDAQINVDYVGIGDYRKFRGLKKSTAYWL
jgi:hypothetical protein